MAFFWKFFFQEVRKKAVFHERHSWQSPAVGQAFSPRMAGSRLDISCFGKGSIIVCSCFISIVRWKYSLFSPVFFLAEYRAKVFCRLFLWNFKEKNINHFLWHSHFYFRHSPKRRLWEMPDVSKPKLLALSWHIVVLSLQYIENTNFLFVFSRWRTPCLDDFTGYSFGTGSV